MKYLKKDMVKRVIELSRVCPPARDFTAEEIAQGLRGKLPLEPATQAFNQYLKEIGAEAVAELIALMWLGQDLLKKPEDWGGMVAEATDRRMGEIFTISKSKLGPYLRAGMERLVRANKQQQRAVEPSPGRIILAKGNSSDPQAKATTTIPESIFATAPVAHVAPGPEAVHGRNDAVAEARRVHLAGSFVLDSFRARYGERGLIQLGKMLEQQGYLRREELGLFALERVPHQDLLEAVLTGK